MKLNYRDKVILAVVLALIVLIGGFFGLIRPKSNEIKENKATLAARQAEKADKERKIAKIKPLTEEIEKLYNETGEISKIFVPMEEVNTTVKLDEYMQTLANENNVRISTLNLGETEVSQLEFYYYTPNDVGGDLRSEADFSGELTLDYASKVAESAALSARTPENVLCTQYGVSVKGTKEDIWNYMQAVADIDEAVMINSVSIADYTFGAAGETATTTDEEGNQVSVTVGGGENGESDVQFVISIYSVYTMTKPNTDMPE